MVEKVVAYITHCGRLLVFRHTHFLEAGIQVPAGTIEPGEDPAVAVLREAEEESGLSQFSNPRYLGQDELDLAEWGKQGTIRRRFFHLEASGDLPERWLHEERHPSEGDETVFEFELYWALLDAVPPLAGRQDAFLHRINL
jgi:8-oxo-dGTP pyrophosphatase MutT (NUDIX family)